jgi:hypothetical protein
MEPKLEETNVLKGETLPQKQGTFFYDAEESEAIIQSISEPEADALEGLKPSTREAVAVISLVPPQHPLQSGSWKDSGNSLTQDVDDLEFSSRNTRFFTANPDDVDTEPLESNPISYEVSCPPVEPSQPEAANTVEVGRRSVENAAAKKHYREMPVYRAKLAPRPKQKEERQTQCSGCAVF